MEHDHKLDNLPILYEARNRGLLRFIQIWLMPPMGIGFSWILFNAWPDLKSYERIGCLLYLLATPLAYLEGKLWYIRFKQQTIEHQTTFGEQREYAYAQVEGFQKTLRGIEIVIRPRKKLKIGRVHGDCEAIEKILTERGVIGR